MDNYQYRLEMEMAVVSHLQEKWGCGFIETEHNLNTKGMYAPIDGFFIKEGKVKSIVENRNRKEKWDDVQRWGGVLINYDKITKGINIAQMLGVSFLFIVYFFNDDKLIYWKIVDEDGMISTKITLQRKVAQKNLQEGTGVKMERNVGVLSNEDAIIISEGQEIFKPR